MPTGSLWEGRHRAGCACGLLRSPARSLRRSPRRGAPLGETRGSSRSGLRSGSRPRSPSARLGEAELQTAAGALWSGCGTGRRSGRTGDGGQAELSEDVRRPPGRPRRRSRHRVDPAFRRGGDDRPCRCSDRARAVLSAPCGPYLATPWRVCREVGVTPSSSLLFAEGSPDAARS